MFLSVAEWILLREDVGARDFGDSSSQSNPVQQPLNKQALQVSNLCDAVDGGNGYFCVILSQVWGCPGVTVEINVKGSQTTPFRMESK